MLKYLVFALLVSVTTSLVAKEAGWVQVAGSSNDNDVYSVKLHTGELVKNKQGQPIVVMVGKVFHKRPPTVELFKWYVTMSDCTEGYGELVIMDIDGNYQGKTPFAQGAKTVASNIAYALCVVGGADDPKSVGP